MYIEVKKHILHIVNKTPKDNNPKNTQFFRVAQWSNLQQLQPQSWHGHENIQSWMQQVTASQANKEIAKRCSSVVLLTFWSIWLERNNRTFGTNTATANQVFVRIKDEVQNWFTAGAKHLRLSGVLFFFRKTRYIAAYINKKKRIFYMCERHKGNIPLATRPATKVYKRLANYSVIDSTPSKARSLAPATIQSFASSCSRENSRVMVSSFF